MIMEVIGALSTSLMGIYRSQQQLNNSAQKIASGEGDMAQNMVEIITAQDSQGANIDVVKTADEMLKELMYMQH